MYGLYSLCSSLGRKNENFNNQDSLLITMDRVIQCMSCGGEIGKYSCSKCGRVVGVQCFNLVLGICNACSGGRKEGRKNEEVTLH